MSTDSIASVVVQFDNTLFRQSAIKKASYRFGDRCFVKIERDDGITVVTLAPKVPYSDVCALEGEFRNEVLDQELREVVADETQGVRNLLLAQAFSGTSLVDVAGETEDSVTDPLEIRPTDRAKGAS